MSRLLRLALGTVAPTALALPAFAQVDSSLTTRPIAQAMPLATAPTVDGNVAGDPAWEGAQAIDQFWQIQPNAGAAASQRTVVFVGFTDRALHIGLIAYDDEPLEIVSTDSRRDSSLEDTDSFRVLIDGLLDRQNGYVFGTTPGGMEYDGQVSREGAGQFMAGSESGFNQNWDTSWTVRAAVSDIGWSAEMEIPFTSLRFGAEEVQTWGFNFERRVRRNNEISFWAPLSQERNLFQVSEAGSIEGIRVPRQRNLQLTPYVLGESRSGGALAETQSEDEAGFDLKYSITPSLTLDATYNTDFAQVEVDEEQVNLDRFSLFFPEKRAFFLENAGQFTVGNPQEVELFFSRRIGIADGQPVPIEGGLRLSGKIGTRTNVGFLRMSSEEVPGLAPGNDYLRRARESGAAEPLGDRRTVRRSRRRRQLARQRGRRSEPNLRARRALGHRRELADPSVGVGDEHAGIDRPRRRICRLGQLRRRGLELRARLHGGRPELQSGSRLSRAPRLQEIRGPNLSPRAAPRSLESLRGAAAYHLSRLLGFRWLPGDRLPAHGHALGVSNRPRISHGRQRHDGRLEATVRHRARRDGLARHLQPRGAAARLTAATVPRR